MTTAAPTHGPGLSSVGTTGHTPPAGPTTAGRTLTTGNRMTTGPHAAGQIPALGRLARHRVPRTGRAEGRRPRRG
ncbi:hypothetical protein, partial [Nocardia neocaledoniensis]|uniref:hypothetical protein n=1 Tax=Nocardia neocaledoniensis TaxID=236511 RepID=UPI0011BF2F97